MLHHERRLIRGAALVISVVKIPDALGQAIITSPTPRPLISTKLYASKTGSRSTRLDLQNADWLDVLSQRLHAYEV
jgi:hypothetical protein